MPTTDLATGLRAQAEAATHGHVALDASGQAKTWLSRVVGDDDDRTRWATVENSGRKKLEKLLGAVKPYALGVLGGLALAALARRR
jgi:hypothetical protein